MVIYLLIIVITLSILVVRRKYSYWKRNGVPHVKPKFPLGNLRLLGKGVHINELMTHLYGQLKGKHPFGGIYFFTSPVVLALDLDFIKDILVRDFEYFNGRGMYYNETDDPISAHLFNVEGAQWNSLRKKLTPTFSSGKLKLLSPSVIAIADRFRESLEKCVFKSPEVEMKDLFIRYITDVIWTCAFGIECNSLNDPEVELRKVAIRMYENQPLRIKESFTFAFKRLAKKMHVKAVPEDLSAFFFNIVRDVIVHREQNDIQRKDFMNLLIQLMEKGKLEGSEEKVGTLSFNEVVAQAFVFFLAGLSSTSSAMSFCLYELSRHDDIQERARVNVQLAVAKHGGLNYDALMDMHYLEQCMNESLRKYPPGANFSRCVSKDYRVRNSSVVLKKGMKVVVPAYAIHHDVEYYPDPERWDPDRFSPEEVAKRIPFTFMPFGEGSRSCIAARFAVMESKIGLATLLMHFRFTESSKTAVPIVMVPRSSIMVPAGGLWFKVEEICQ